MVAPSVATASLADLPPTAASTALFSAAALSTAAASSTTFFTIATSSMAFFTMVALVASFSIAATTSSMALDILGATTRDVTTGEPGCGEATATEDCCPNGWDTLTGHPLQ
jgi:hypothetical protein